MADLATAYVQIVPSARGMKQNLSNVFGNEMPSAGQSAGGIFGSNLISKIKTALVAAGIGEALKKSITEGAALEQSLGGVETLFKENAAKVIANAEQAYRTAGMSANSYMEQVTSFSASLLQSLAGDTSKAADIADMAMSDMSDNANKFGTDMGRITDAYQGFAKQNYTMLDNLKLGYGGTKTEMQRLLADAQKLTGVKYDINNLSDVYSAIHAIQEELGVTGTTAKEASATLTGSLNAMKAAFSDVMGNLALGRDIGPSLNALEETVFTFFGDNLLPAVGKILTNLPAVVSSALSMAIKSLNLVKNNTKGIVKMGLELVIEIGKAIISALPYLAEAALGIAVELGKAILETDWVQIATDTITDLRENLDLAAGEILGTDGNIVQSVLTAIFSQLPAALDSGVQIVMQIANGILSALPGFMETVGSLRVSLLDMVMSAAPSFLSSGVTLILNLASGLISSLPSVTSAATGVVGQLLSTFAAHLPDLLAQGISMIGQLVAGLISMIPDVISAAIDIGKNVWNVICEIDWLKLGGDIIKGIIRGLLDAASSLYKAIRDIIKNALKAGKDETGETTPSSLSRRVLEGQLPAGTSFSMYGGIPLMQRAINDLMDATSTEFISHMRVNSRFTAPRFGLGAAEDNGRSVVIHQYIYSEAKTAADLMREARYQAEEAVLFGV